jgi:hypothetical protein
MSSPASAVTEPPTGRGGEAPATLPRLLAGILPDGAMALDRHLSVHGPLPHVASGRRRDRHEADRLIDEIDRAGLLGRGGGAFPTATKMRAVAGTRGRPIVVANGA